MSNQVYETLYKGDTPHWPDTDECLTLATTFVEAMMGLQGDGEEAPSWIKLPADNEEAPYGADLADRLCTLAQANENVSVPKPTSKPDIFDDEMYQTILDFFTHAYVERLMVATTSGKAPSKILMDLDLPLDGWVNENVLINALTQTQSLMSLRENAAVTLDRGIGSTEALLKDDTLNATYPTAAMMAYLEELNAYILAAGDDGRSMSGLSPLPVYQKGIGKQVTGTLVNFYEYRKALGRSERIPVRHLRHHQRRHQLQQCQQLVPRGHGHRRLGEHGPVLHQRRRIRPDVGQPVGRGLHRLRRLRLPLEQQPPKTAKNAVGVVQSQMPASMGSLTDLLTQQALLTANTGELFGALAQWSKVDPQLR